MADFDCSILTPRKFKAWLEKKGDEVVGEGRDETSCPITNYVLDTLGMKENVDPNPIYANSLYKPVYVRTGYEYTRVGDGECTRKPDSRLTKFVRAIDRAFPHKKATGKQALEVLQRVCR